ncbi:MAG: MIP family channel protein [Bacteroidales bacterium]|jgi:aquaporin Z|nr:MIP family channel protein [Bacteroidales bacterium]MBQ2483564.1 MIP family channel protein [Bacteroidales bacterium]MBQ2491770.1 MIP family channel protein [Bacteroidales bacterium]MBQ4196460.1 MIP family channel protein [Bacteroidales bacterium]
MKKYLAEMFGTMVLVLMGCGVAVSLNCSSDCSTVANAATVIGTALAFGLAVVAMAYTIGGVSGCHINPAITLGVLLSGRMSVKDGILYIVFQCIGAFIGSALLYLLTTNSGLVGTGANDLQAGVTTLGGLLAEIIFTCVFVLVVLGATSKTNGATNNFAGLAIGLSLVLVHLVCIRYTGTSVNPARSLAPAFFQGGSALSNLWIFIVGPFAGAILAAGIWGIIAGCNCKKEEK